MRLQNAYLCIDCDEIFDPLGQGGKHQCPACTSRSCAPISGWITSWSAYDRLAEKPVTVPEAVEAVVYLPAAIGM